MDMEKSVDYTLQRNIKRIGHLDIAGGGQVVVDGGYAYVGHMKPPHGTTILDISDPGSPKVVSTIEPPDPFSHTHKVRVVGDLMFTNVEQYDRHFLRKGDAIPAIRARLGQKATDADIAAELGVEAARIGELDEARERGYGEGGFRIHDIADKSNPDLRLRRSPLRRGRKLRLYFNRNGRLHRQYPGHLRYCRPPRPPRSEPMGDAGTASGGG
jgi:hypothetical protein